MFNSYIVNIFWIYLDLLRDEIISKMSPELLWNINDCYIFPFVNFSLTIKMPTSRFRVWWLEFKLTIKSDGLCENFSGKK